MIPYNTILSINPHPYLIVFFSRFRNSIFFFSYSQILKTYENLVREVYLPFRPRDKFSKTRETRVTRVFLSYFLLKNSGTPLIFFIHALGRNDCLVSVLIRILRTPTDYNLYLFFFAFRGRQSNVFSAEFISCSFP